MKNVICRLWGHDEVDDQEHLVIWCSRCGETIAEYGYFNEELNHSLYVGRYFTCVKYKIIHVAKCVKDNLMRYVYGDDYDIPF